MSRRWTFRFGDLSFVRIHALLLGLAVSLAPAAAGACYCVYPELEGSIDKADVIFEGIAPSDPVNIEADIGLGAYGDVQTARYGFEVLRYFKSGVGLPARLDLHTPVQAPACGRQFARDETYLIYARQREDGRLTDFRCSRTRTVQAASEDLSELGEGVAPEDWQLSALDVGEGLVGTGETTPELAAAPEVTSEVAGGCALRARGSNATSLAAFALGLFGSLLVFRRRNASPAR
jgi:hypothetical protein